MKVIFLKALKGKGKEGEIKEFSNGYAQNFLIPKGYAVLYTPRSKEILETSIKTKSTIEEKNIEECNKIKEKLEKETLIFTVKTGEKDHVFGSVSTKQIEVELEQKGYKIDKKKIVIDSPLSSLGSHEIKIILHPKVIVKLIIQLVK